MALLSGCHDKPESQPYQPSNEPIVVSDFDANDHLAEQQKRSDHFHYWMKQYKQNPNPENYEKVMMFSEPFMNLQFDKLIEFYLIAMEKTPESQAFDYFLVHFVNYSNDGCNIELNQHNLSKYNFKPDYIYNLIIKASKYSDSFKRDYALMLLNGTGVKKDEKNGKKLLNQFSNTAFDRDKCI